LPALAIRLLPTPVEGDSRNSRNSTAYSEQRESRRPGDTLSDVASRWSGGSTSPPSEDGSPSWALRLSPWFTEWLMGAPPGWSDPTCVLTAEDFRRSATGCSSSWG
jgi:hypothetical protein